MNIGNPRSLLVKFVLCTLLLVLLTGTTAVAQAGRGGISGTITDPSGAVVAKAKVTALNHATGIVQQSVSSAAGLYSFVSLNPGSYEVTATVKGFDSVVEDNVTVNVDQVSEIFREGQSEGSVVLKTGQQLRMSKAGWQSLVAVTRR